MYKMTQEIYNVLSANNNLKVFTEEKDGHSTVWLQFRTKIGSTYKIRFISTNDQNDVAVRVFSLVNVEEASWPKLLPTINELNREFRFVKFVLDQDGDVNIEYDFPLESNPTVCAEEILIRILKIIDQAYPTLMRAIWQ